MKRTTSRKRTTPTTAMKRKVRFDVDGDQVIAEWDSLFRAYTVNLFGLAAHPAAGAYSGPMLYFLGRAGQYETERWENGQIGGWVKVGLRAPDLESLVRKMVLAFRRDYPRPS